MWPYIATSGEVPFSSVQAANLALPILAKPPGFPPWMAQAPSKAEEFRSGPTSACSHGLRILSGLLEHSLEIGRGTPPLGRVLSAVPSRYTTKTKGSKGADGASCNLPPVSPAKYPYSRGGKIMTRWASPSATTTRPSGPTAIPVGNVNDCWSLPKSPQVALNSPSVVQARMR
jgi:hypothetical protein